MVYRFFAFLSVLLFAGSAHADFGDLAVGGQMGVGAMALKDDSGLGGSTTAHALMLQPEMNLRVGLTDWLNLDTGAGFAFFDGISAGSIDLGVTGAIDIFALVPELKLGLFLIMLREDDSFRAMLGLDAAIALRYHLDFNWSVAVGAELNVAIVPRYQGTISFLYVID